MPLHLKRIGERAFFNSQWLEEIIIPEGVEEIANSAFEIDGMKSRALKRLSLPSSLKKIGDWVFFNHQLEELTLPEGLEEIGYNAFQGGGSTMAELTIPASVKKIGAEAFAGNTKLERVEFLSTDLEYIGQHAFKETPWFEGLPNGISALTDNAYLYKYEKMEESELRIPKEVVGIGVSKSYEIGSLDSLYFEDGVYFMVMQKIFSYFSQVDTVRFPSQLTGQLPTVNKVKTFNVPKGIDELPSVKPDNAIEKIYLECSLQHWQELLLGLELPDRSWYTGAAVYEYSSVEPTKSGNYWHYVNGEIVEW